MAFYPRPGSGELEMFARKIAMVIAFACAAFFLWAVRGVLILVFIAAVLAAGIAPAVWRVQVVGRRYMRRRIQRGTAVLIVYFPFLLLTVFVAFMTVPRLIIESRELSAQLPTLIETNILRPLERFFPMNGVREAISQAEATSLPRSQVFGYVRSTVEVFASLVAVLFMVVYMLMDSARLRNMMLLFYPAEERGQKRRMFARMGKRMSSWLSGQLLLAGIMGLAVFIGLLVVRIPYAVPLALLAAMGEMVPVIGPILGLTPSLIIALLRSPWQFWSVLIMALLFQKAENLFVAPRVMSRKVLISPLAVFIAFMMGASLLGIIGALMAIPMAAIIQVVFAELFVTQRERRQDFGRTGSLMKRPE
jgi:predicted PurR-regulated permease PerM